MKKISSILILAALIMALDATAQKGDKKEKELKSEQIQERSRSLGGQRTESDRLDTVPNPKADTVSTSDNSTGSAGVVERNKDQSGQPAKGSAPTVIQRTSSESGSPAVLSNDDEGRDGTNNVQRAKPNIAGAKEPGNLNLSKKNSGEKNIKAGKAIQKQEERPNADVSKGRQTATSQKVREKSDDETMNPDENLSKKEKRKERRKNRRNKDKDSGK